jgi:hypothetical protein
MNLLQYSPFRYLSHRLGHRYNIDTFTSLTATPLLTEDKNVATSFSRSCAGPQPPLCIMMTIRHNISYSNIPTYDRDLFLC